MTRTRLFHCVVVIGSSLSVPALAVGTIGALAVVAAGCDDGYVGIAADIGVLDVGYVDIGVPPDGAHPIDGGGVD